MFSGRLVAAVWLSCSTVGWWLRCDCHVQRSAGGCGVAAGVPTSICHSGSLGRECRTVQMSLHGHSPICGQQCHSKTHFGFKVPYQFLRVLSDSRYFDCIFLACFWRNAIWNRFWLKKCICCYREFRVFLRLIPVILGLPLVAFCTTAILRYSISCTTAILRYSISICSCIPVR